LPPNTSPHSENDLLLVNIVALFSYLDETNWKKRYNSLFSKSNN